MDFTEVTRSPAFLERFIADLAALVAIPSVSTSPKHEPDIRAAGDWLMQQLSEMGMDKVRRLESPRHPSVFAEWNVDDAAPTVLIYGHYDVQPAEPLELWDSPPFELTDRGDRVYARGATDDKAGVVGTLRVIRTLKEHGVPPAVNLKGRKKLAARMSAASWRITGSCWPVISWSVWMALSPQSTSRP